MGVKKVPRRYNKEQLRQVEGRNAVREALRAGKKVVNLMIEESIKFDDRITEIYNLARQRNIDIDRPYPSKMKRLSKTGGHHQGVIAQIELEAEEKIEVILNNLRKTNKTPFFIILTNVLYEHNLGAVLRSAETTGVDAVLVNNKTPQLTAIVERTAVGAGEYVPLIHTNLFTTLNYLRNEGVKIFGAREGNNKIIYRCDFTLPIAIVIGAEDKGISDPISKNIDQFISIPLLGKIESLNMSVAAALCMYEVVRQRKYSQNSIK